MNPEETKIPDSEEEQSVPVKTETVDDHCLAAKRKIIYEQEADASFEFLNGESIHINRTALALESTYFFDVFSGSSPYANVVLDFDSGAFQTFIDCLFGLKEYSVLDALIIYPIAHKYDVKKCLRKCVSVLQPTDMNENVCLSLNLALRYECEGLVDDIITFFQNQVGIVSLLENENYCRVLEPRTMCKLIEHINLDSYVWKIIYNWGKAHMGSLNDINLFFTNCNILEKLSLDDFESVQSIFDFHNFTNKQLLNSDEILSYLENNLTKKSEEKLPEKSYWAQVQKGDEITETIVFKNSVVVESKDLKNGFTLNIWKNLIHLKSPLSDWSAINYKARLNFKSLCLRKDEAYVTVDHSLSNSGNASGMFESHHTFSFGSVHEISENFIGLNRKLSFPIKLQHPVSEVKSVEITFTFPFDCRILKTSISENFVDADKLYFTKDVAYSQQ